jgi:hypothetical protein
LNRLSRDGIIRSRMTRRAALLSSILALATPSVFAQEVVKHVGQVTFRVDQDRAFPGGVMVVRLSSRGRLGTAFAILDGRRAPFYLARGVPRALVPVPVSAVPGPNTLGIELVARAGRQRIPISVDIAPRTYPARSVVIPEAKRALLSQPSVTRDGRQLLSFLRTETAGEPRALAPPITIVAGLGFGAGPTSPGRRRGSGAERVRGIRDYLIGRDVFFGIRFY